MKNFKKGFTLVEMLIVVVIIGILAAAILPRLQGAQAAARDTARKTALNQLAQGLELYNATKGAYPQNLAEDTKKSAEQLQGDLVPAFLKNIPTNPSKDVKTTAIPNGASAAKESTDGNYLIIKSDNTFILAARVERAENANWVADKPLPSNNTFCSSVAEGGTAGEISNLSACTAPKDKFLYVLPIN